MPKQVVGLFDTMQDARDAVQELRNVGFGAEDISVVASNAGGDSTTDAGDGGGSEAAEGAGVGATGGAVLGGLGGLLVGLGALAIPGIGPVVAAGTLATALTTTAVGAGLGAAAGGLVGALVGAGIPEEDANVYAEGIRRGGALVTVRADADEDADRAADILDRHNVVDIDERGANYRAAGWSGFDDSAGGYDTGTGRATVGASAGTAGATTDYGTADRGMTDDTSGRSTADSDRSEWAESSKVGTAGGGLAGAATGAAIGSVGGPVGTVIGGVAGAVTGGGVGAAGDAAGEAASDRSRGEDDLDTSRSGYTGTADRGTGAAMGSATDYSTTDRTTTDYTTTDRTTADYTTTDTSRAGFQTGTRDIDADQGEVAIPVVEEELRVGTREVETGGVRVETRVEETPVQEQVTLRDEQVRVERRAVDQPVDASTIADAFREGTFEVRERHEEAVVAKEARVVEEVVINKEAQERTETIQDTVRRTDVDVEEIAGQTRTSGYTETGRTTGTGVSDVGTTGTSGAATTGDDEGPIERTLGDAKSATERTTGLDLDRSGDVGDRDRRDNF